MKDSRAGCGGAIAFVVPKKKFVERDPSEVPEEFRKRCNRTEGGAVLVEVMGFMIHHQLLSCFIICLHHTYIHIPRFKKNIR